MSVLPALKYLVVPPKAAHTSTIIFLHGLGDTGAGWQPVAEMLAPSSPGTKWILPHARIMPVTINSGVIMSSWFDVTSLSDRDKDDEVGMRTSSLAVNELITAEVDAGTPAEKIILGGSSQGCALSLLTGLTTERRLAGLACLSGRLRMRREVQLSITDNARKLPIFWGHGTQDDVVTYQYGKMSVDFIKDTLKVEDVTFKSYHMGHTLHPQELEDLKSWLKKVLSE